MTDKSDGVVEIVSNSGTKKANTGMALLPIPGQKSGTLKISSARLSRSSENFIAKFSAATGIPATGLIHYGRRTSKIKGSRKARLKF
ncbi:MAG: hypothetical protein L6Q57_08885 [Alphaproteobacteria bacterium]|nr:hypothetical protein [Alphaproteobacteria bacterium]